MNMKMVARELVAVAKGLSADLEDYAGALRVENALPELENRLKPMLGFSPRLARKEKGRDWVAYEDDVGHSAMGVFSSVFKRATVVAVVSGKPLDDGSYYVNVDLRWESHRGGTNGQDVATAWFYPDKGTWVVEQYR